LWPSYLKLLVDFHSVKKLKPDRESTWPRLEYWTLAGSCSLGQWSVEGSITISMNYWPIQYHHAFFECWNFCRFGEHATNAYDHEPYIQNNSCAKTFQTSSRISNSDSMNLKHFTKHKAFRKRVVVKAKFMDSMVPKFQTVLFRSLHIHTNELCTKFQLSRYYTVR
jgi:hypothetical protein